MVDFGRLWFWMSVCIMDKLVNLIFGCFVVMVGVYLDMRSVFDVYNVIFKILVVEVLSVVYGIVSIINDIICKVYEKKEIIVRVVE